MARRKVRKNPALVIYNPPTAGESPAENVGNAIQMLDVACEDPKYMAAVKLRLRKALNDLRAVKKNPPFKLPRGGNGGAMTIRVPHVISDELVEIRYGFGGEFYKHEVETPARLYAALTASGARCLLVIGKDGQPLWASDGEVQSGRYGR